MIAFAAYWVIAALLKPQPAHAGTSILFTDIGVPRAWTQLPLILPNKQDYQSAAPLGVHGATTRQPRLRSQANALIGPYNVLAPERVKSDFWSSFGGVRGDSDDLKPASYVWTSWDVKDPKGSDEEEDLEWEVDAKFWSQAWKNVSNVRLFGPHEFVPSPQLDLRSRLHAMYNSAIAADWYFFAIALAIMFSVDVIMLQHLPEIKRTHCGLLTFWILVAVAFGTEVWLRLGPEVGSQWLAGYLLEFVYSSYSVLVFHLIFQAFDTPRRLIRKAMFGVLIAGLCFRFALILGLSVPIWRLRLVPYALGLWFVYCGAQQVGAISGGGEEGEGADVTQTLAVRVMRSFLGSRLGEFYDEDGEAVFLFTGKRACVTLLGLVMFQMLVADFLLALDVSLVKLEGTSNGYVNFTSSAIALFSVRSVFFVARDAFLCADFMKYGVGFVLVFVGMEMLVGRFLFVNALNSFLLCVIPIAALVIVVALRQLCTS